MNSARPEAGRGCAHRFDAAQARDIIQADAADLAPDICPYTPYYWLGFKSLDGTNRWVKPITHLFCTLVPLVLFTSTQDWAEAWYAPHELPGAPMD